MQNGKLKRLRVTLFAKIKNFDNILKKVDWYSALFTNFVNSLNIKEKININR